MPLFFYDLRSRRAPKLIHERKCPNSRGGVERESQKKLGEGFKNNPGGKEGPKTEQGTEVGSQPARWRVPGAHTPQGMCKTKKGRPNYIPTYPGPFAASKFPLTSS